MSFFNELRQHAEDMSSPFLAEVRAFINYVESKYSDVTAIPVSPVEASVDDAPVAIEQPTEIPAETPAEPTAQ